MMHRHARPSMALSWLITALACTWAQADQIPAGANVAREHATSRVSFFQVPLVCGAAPQIGCGSRARPVLLEVDHLPGVAAARLNRSGTVLAVVWADEGGAGTAARDVSSLLEAKGLTSVELTGEPREQALAAFNAGTGWYRAEDVGRLSEEEAGVIAARLVRRVTAKVPLPARQAEALRSAWETVFRSRISSQSPNKNRDTQIEAELVRAGRKHLNKGGMAALREAIALGYRPVAGEL